MSKLQAQIILSGGIAARGRKEFHRHAAGEKLSPQQSIRAKCYECMAGYTDGVGDCAMPDCPLYPLHPYNPNRQKKAVKRAVFKKCPGEAE